ncbi:MAG TPA: hypothetical protein VER96_15550 [Polyangiaceae bacterium]|nr:hypothetical protein [Polyangiaceae bacterium]
MARRICLWLPSLTVLALSACGGSETDFFGGNGSAGSNHAGNASHAGSTSSSGTGNSGSAGKSSSAGTTGVAGDLGSAGDSSIGGQGVGGNGNGGSPSAGSSAGGRAGANGSGGTGHAGSAGSGATAGHAGAQTGSAGSGGTNQDAGCSDLLKQASQQLEAARECNPNAKSIQCTGTVKNTCGCEVPVQRDDSSETRAYLATLKKIDAKNCTTVCTAQACKVVTDAECQSSGSDGAGVCTAVSPGHGF